MLFVKRFWTSHLKTRRMPHRFQSNKRPVAPLGSRVLLDPDKVFDHNMWDHMKWSQEEEETAKQKATENSLIRVQPELQGRKHLIIRSGPGEAMLAVTKEDVAEVIQHMEPLFSDRAPAIHARKLLQPVGSYALVFEHFQESNRLPEWIRFKNQDNTISAKYEREASRYWNEFYRIHKNRFFKDRKWLFAEFPEILPEGKPDLCRKVITENLRCTGLLQDNHLCEDNSAAKVASVLSVCCDNAAADERIGKSTEKQFPGRDASYRILEVGCGAGNSVFPILEVTRHHPGVFLYCCDFASEAVELIKSAPLMDSSRCFAFVHDVCDDASPYPFPEESLDVVLLIFVLSSIHPDRIRGVVSRLARLLKPGGMILFRDRGRYDVSQLRFKKGHCLSENFYVKGDGTRTYFFTKDEIHSIFSSAGLTEVQNLLDRRLQVNRKKKVKMHRFWIQGKFQKQKS